MNRKAENHYIGKEVYWTVVKGGKVNQGTITHIQGSGITVANKKGSWHLFADEVWSTKELARRHPAL